MFSYRIMTQTPRYLRHWWNYITTHYKFDFYYYHRHWKMYTCIKAQKVEFRILVDVYIYLVYQIYVLDKYIKVF